MMRDGWLHQVTHTSAILQLICQPNTGESLLTFCIQLPGLQVCSQASSRKLAQNFAGLRIQIYNDGSHVSKCITWRMPELILT